MSDIMPVSPLRSAAHRELSEADRAAIEWEACLRDGEGNATAQADFANWLAIDAHRGAWDRLQRRLAPLKALQDQRSLAVSTALRTPSASRRRLLKGAFGAASLVLGGVGIARTMHYFGFDADWQSAVGERQQLTLADGTQILLDAQTRVYRAGDRMTPGFSIEQGQLLLRSAVGDMMTRTISTADGRISARAAVLTVGRLYRRTVVSLASGEATLHRVGQPSIAMQAGDTVYFNASHAQRTRRSFDEVSAWTQGLLVADRTALPELFDAFNRYHPGDVRVVGGAAERRISGVFRLDQLKQALCQVCDNLPVTVDHFGRYLTIVS